MRSLLKRSKYFEQAHALGADRALDSWPFPIAHTNGLNATQFLQKYASTLGQSVPKRVCMFILAASRMRAGMLPLGFNNTERMPSGPLHSRRRRASVPCHQVSVTKLTCIDFHDWCVRGGASKIYAHVAWTCSMHREREFQDE